MEGVAQPPSNVVEVNAEEMLRQFYEAEDAAAIVVDMDDGVFQLEGWYTGTLHHDTTPFIENLDDGWVHAAGIGPRLGDDMVEFYYAMARHGNPLGIIPLRERYQLEATAHDRVFVEDDVGEAARRQGRRIAAAFSGYVILAKTAALDEPVTWGYRDGYDCVTVAYRETLSAAAVTEILQELSACEELS